MEEINNLRSPSLAIRKDSKTISKVSSSTIINTTKPKIRIIHIFAPEIIKTDVANFRELVQRLTGKPTEKDQCCKKESITKSKPKNNNSSSVVKNIIIPTTPASSSSSLDNNSNYYYDNNNNDDDNQVGYYSKLNAYFPTKPIAMKMDYTTSGGFQGFDYLGMADQQRVVKMEEEDEEEEEEIVDEAHHHHHGMWDMINNKGHDENAISSSNCTTTGFLEGFLGFEELTGDEFHNLLPNLDNSHVMQFGFGGPQLV
ncbi:uncharacterized protein LOC115700955 [Cannabis sativa]|uniref:uncharacterized protein LOC115700955 n=1 Tax=Cannabis sativa TaxID=3483 RepID=UPI0029C9E4A0|nr:uncharacterized protein LOC115700955 [Cannabis sativa]